MSLGCLYEFAQGWSLPLAGLCSTQIAARPMIVKSRSSFCMRLNNTGGILAQIRNV